MRSTFLQILLIFSSPEAYRLQFSSPRAYFVYTVWHCTGQHCIHVRIICLPVCGASWWVLLQHPVTLRVFFIIECGIVCFLCAMRVLAVWASSSSPRLSLYQILFHGLHYWASPWRKIVYSITHSLTRLILYHSLSLFDALGTEACASENSINLYGQSSWCKLSSYL